MAEIIIAIIAAVGAMAGSFFANNANIAVLKNQIETLSNRVDTHNKVIERTYKLEKDVAVLQNKNKVSEHRVDDLESSVKTLENSI